MEDVQSLNLDLRLEDTLTIIEGSLVGEGDGAKLKVVSIILISMKGSSYRNASHEVDAVRDIDESRIKSSGRDIEMVATAWGSLSAVVAGVFQEIGEVVNNFLCVGIRHALSAGSRCASGARVLASDGGSDSDSLLPVARRCHSHGLDCLGDSNSLAAVAGKRSDVDGLGGGAWCNSGGLDLSEAEARASTPVASLVASTCIVGNIVGANLNSSTLLVPVLPCGTLASNGGGHSNRDWGDGGNLEAGAVGSTELVVSKSCLASDCSCAIVTCTTTSLEWVGGSKCCQGQEVREVLHFEKLV